MKWLFVLAGLLAAPASAETVVLKVSGAGEGGRIVASLYASAAGFSGFDSKKAVAVQTAPVSAGGGAVLRFEGVKPGRYAVSAFHDADGDGRLKTNFIGMPREAVGVSNNPGGMPSFEKSVIVVPANGPIDIILRRIGG